MSLRSGQYRLETDEGDPVLPDFYTITDPYELAHRIEQQRHEPVTVRFANDVDPSMNPPSSSSDSSPSSD
jgi:hypothetical protein